MHPVCRLLVPDESTHTCTSRCMEQSDGVQGLPYSAFADSPSLHQEMPLSGTHADVSLCCGPQSTQQHHSSSKRKYSAVLSPQLLSPLPGEPRLSSQVLQSAHHVFPKQLQVYPLDGHNVAV